ncbi:HNH endonuclease [Peribacillus frigoritolerans]|uniref:phage lytic cycle repressor MrpR family protein n=1 Tax=Peribacillus frigoritolerans TaxID=450367 RepID=UPI0039A39899
MFNIEQKLIFLEQMKGSSYVGLYKWIFNASVSMEQEFGKDLYLFDLNELSELMKKLAPKTRNSSNGIYYRLFHYIDFFKNIREDKSNPFLSVEPNWCKQFVDKTHRTFFNENELDEIIGKCVNAQDAVIFRLLFEGVFGQNDYNEILNLKKDDIDWDKRVLYLKDGENKRTLEVSEKCIDLLRKAIEEKDYKLSNGESTARSPTQPLILNDYVIRGLSRKAKEARHSHLILRRVTKLFKKVFEYPNVTAKTLSQSGMIKAAVDISIEREIKINEFTYENDWSKVAERFNVTPTKNGQYPGITMYVYSEIVEELYGEQVDYIIKDFELINEEDKSDNQVVEKTKRESAPAFREKMKSVYGKCVITRESVYEVLEACHIQPYKNEDSNHIQNGILLRVDIHKLFDKGLIAIDDCYLVRVSPLLKSEYYQSLDGLKIQLPTNKNLYPSKKSLQYKMSFFKKIMI